MPVTSLKCVKCGSEYPLEMIYTCEKCGNILDVQYDHEKFFNEINTKIIFKRKGGVWKYKELLPIKDYSKIVSLGEGGTGLHKCNKLGEKLGIDKLYVKDETRNPTGSFKDRPISVAVTKANEFGVNTVITSSSGNAGASLSAYAAKAGMKCFVFVPANVGMGCLSQMIAYGAKVVTVKGSCSDSFKLVETIAKKHNWFNTTSTFLNPYATEGDKTLAYEVSEQLNWKVPDWMFIPIGVGPLLVGSFKGFMEFNLLGLIDNLPSMVGVQAKGCAPIVRSFKEGAKTVKPWDEPKTVATGIADPLQGYAQDGTLTLETIRKSKGVAVAVQDEEILEALKLLARTEGIFAEPTGAVPIAGLRKLIDEGVIDKDDMVVCAITGHGLKDFNSLSISKKPVAIGPNIKELEKMFRGGANNRNRD